MIPATQDALIQEDVSVRNGKFTSSLHNLETPYLEIKSKNERGEGLGVWVSGSCLACVKCWFCPYVKAKREGGGRRGKKEGKE